MRGVLCLEDGFSVQGDLLSFQGEALGEVVFCTGMTGYEEALIDPSYAGQILVFTFPMIGNYGLPPGSGQSPSISVRGMVARDIWTGPVEDGVTSLASGLMASGRPALTGLDTRGLVLHLRDRGSLRGIIAPVPEGGLNPTELERLTQRAAEFDMRGITAEVACKETTAEGDARANRGTCVLVDFGAKASITKELLAAGYRVVKVPPKTSAEQILGLRPSCVLLSNGPGDPLDNPEAIEAADSLLGKVPVYGICLGHQIIAKAAGARTTKLKYGHHGGNHPVKDLHTGRAFVTSQNHNYAVENEGLPQGMTVTHRNLNDGSIEGLELRDPASGRFLAASVQFHPEGASGPGYRQFWARLEGGVVHA
ncbi:MAG: glutamine-hydrolyzing carbamoyl-phosphate synthase small subunit [Bacillota bacterium]